MQIGDRREWVAAHLWQNLDCASMERDEFDQVVKDALDEFFPAAADGVSPPQPQDGEKFYGVSAPAWQWDEGLAAVVRAMAPEQSSDRDRALMLAAADRIERVDEADRASGPLPPPPPTDDLDAYIRESAEKDPAFATAYLNAQARSTVCGLVDLLDSGAVDWSKVPNGTDNAWLRQARIIERDANPDAASGPLPERGPTDELAVCREAYTNANEERGMYQAAYEELRDAAEQLAGAARHSESREGSDDIGDSQPVPTPAGDIAEQLAEAAQAARRVMMRIDLRDNRTLSAELCHGILDACDEIDAALAAFSAPRPGTQPGDSGVTPT